MPFSLTGGGNNGGGVTGEVSLSAFKLQASYPPVQTNTELIELFSFSNPCKLYIFNEGPDLAEIRFAADDLNESAILIDSGVSWVETFSRVALWAKSEGQSKLRITLLFNEPSVIGPIAGMSITPLEVIAGEPNTGFEVTTVPVTFLLEIRRENLGIDIQDSGVIIEILLQNIYELTAIPVILGTDVFESQNEYYFSQQFANNSLIWQRSVTIQTPGRYFIGSYFNWAAATHIARLDIDLENSKITVLSEIAI